MALRLGELATILSADCGPLKRDLAKGKQLVKEHGQDMKKAGLAAGAMAGAALGVGLIGALDMGAANAKVSASLGATPAEAEKIGQLAGRLYADAWGGSMGEVSAAVGAVISSIDGMRSASADDLEAMTKKALALATTFGLDVSRATQVAGQAVRAGLAEDGVQAVDLLTASMQRVPAAVRDDLVDAVDEYGPFLASIGIQGEQAFGLLVKGAEKGMYGLDKTGDALKEFTIRATDMSAASKVGYDILGMSQEKMSRALLEGGAAGEKAFNQIITGLQNIKDPVEQSQAALALFGTPLEDLSVQEIPAFLAGLNDAKGALGDVEGATDDVADTLHDDASASLTRFKRQAQGALVDALVKALPVLTAVGGFLAQYSDVVVPLTVALGAFGAAVWAVNAATAAYAAVQAVANLAIWSFPLTWIIAGVVALVAVIVVIATKTDWFQRLWKAAWGGIKTAASAVGSWFKNTLWGKWIKGAWNSIVSAGNKTLGWFKSLSGSLRRALTGVANTISAPFRAAFNAIARFWNSTVGKLSFRAPGWVPGIGGKGFSLPRLPQLARGGTALAPGLAIVGEQGPELVHLGRGATVQPLTGSSGGSLADLARTIVAAARDRSGDILEATIDLGEGIREVVRIRLSEHDRQLRRRVTAGASI